ncbi:MAG: TIGR02099 family protein [Burkholderiales bacterium]|nr:TIGR02099 family protein [Burkholderiales bacterium]
MDKFTSPEQKSGSPSRVNLGAISKFFIKMRGACIIAAFHAGYGFRKSMRLCFKLLLVLYFLSAFVFLLMRYVLLPQVTQYKPEIEQYVSQQIGRPVKIAQLQASWQGLNPLISLRNLQIQDQSGHAAFVLPELNARISWWSFLVFDLSFAHIELANARLNIKRDREGKLEVAGIPLGSNQHGGEADQLLSWVLSQHEISIRDASLVWDDQYLGNPLLELNSLQFSLRNHWHHHQFALQATPPIALSAPIDVRGSFQQSAFAPKKIQLNSWSGDLYADLRQADLLVVHRYLALPVKLEKGWGNLRSWLKLDHGRVVDFTADVRLVDVVGKFRKDLPELDMAQISGRVIASEFSPKLKSLLSRAPVETGHRLALLDFSMQTRDGLVLPETSFTESFLPAQNGQSEKVELYARSVDLHSLANFAEHLPLPADQRRLLIDVAPKGVLKDFSAHWQGSFPDVSSYQIKGQFFNLEMQPQKAQLARPKTAKLAAKAAVPAIPGFDNLSGTIDANDKGGHLTLDSSDLQLQTPSYFVDPLMPFKRLQMRAKWTLQEDNQLLFEIDDMQFQQDESKGSVQGTHRISLQGGDLGTVDLTAQVNRFDLKNINRYIPAHTPDNLRHWLSHALLDGEAQNVSLRLKGALSDFPFYVSGQRKENQQAEFIVKGDIQNGQLNFLPGVLAKDGTNPFWPVIDHIKGRFVFDRARMEILGDTAMSLGVNLSKVKAVIPDLGDHQAVLQIDGLATGALQGMLNYVAASPVEDWLGGFLHETTASGNANLNLKLILPLKALPDSKVVGQLQLNSVESRLLTDLPVISALTGRIDFNERGVSLNNLKGNVLGGVAQASGGTQRDGAIRIKLDGIASADGVRQHFKQADLTKPLSLLSGESAYQAQINVKNRLTEVIVDTNLQGFASTLPIPLNKSASEIWPARFEMIPEATTDSSEWRDQIKLHVGDKINAVYLRKKGKESNAPWTVARGVVAVNTEAVLPEQGLSLHFATKQFNLDEWRKVLGTEARTEEVSASKAASPDHQMLSGFAQYCEPTVFSLVTDELIVFGKKLEKLVIGASRQAGLWQSNVDSHQISGFLTWNGVDEKKNAGQLRARLSRLVIPKSAASDVGDLLEAKNTTQHIPNLDVQAEHFELFDKKMGQLNLLANNSSIEQGREWQIEKLQLKSEDAQLNAHGKWTVGPKDSHTQLNYVWDINNVGKLLDKLGFPDWARAGKGQLEGQMNWNGLPFDLDIPSLSGDLQLKLSNGQILKVNAPQLKLLSVVSMQALRRRLTLDFRDMLAEGIAFDTIFGTAKIKQGVLRTDNFKMSSVNMVALMEGQVDLHKETQDVHLAVIPEANAGGASVLLGLAVNPVIGLSTFLAQLFLRDPINKAVTTEYKVTGSWDNPVTTEIENKERQRLLEKRKAEQAKAESSPQKDNAQ